MEFLAHHSANHTENMNLPVLAVLALLIVTVIVIGWGKKNEG